MERSLVQETGCSWRLAHEAVGEAKASSQGTPDATVLAAAKEIIKPKLDQDKIISARHLPSSNRNLPNSRKEGKDRDPLRSGFRKTTGSNNRKEEASEKAIPTVAGAAATMPSPKEDDDKPPRGTSSLSRSSSSRRSVKSFERTLVQQTGCSWKLAHKAVEEAKASGTDSTDYETVLARSKAIVGPKLEDDKTVTNRHLPNTYASAANKPNERDPLRSGFRETSGGKELEDLRAPETKNEISPSDVAAGVGIGAATGVGVAAIAGNNEKSKASPSPADTPATVKDTADAPVVLAAQAPNVLEEKGAAKLQTTTFEISSDVSTWLEECFDREDIATIVLSAASKRPLSRYMKSKKSKSRKPKSSGDKEITLLRGEFDAMRKEMQEVIKHSDASTEPVTTDPESP